jgi:hypothetical protein
MSKQLALAGALALACYASATLADTLTDAGGTISAEIVDVSRTAHPHIQCTLTVTASATLLTSLWSTAGCATFPIAPQFAFVEPTSGAVWYRTDGTAPSATTGMEIFQSQAWPIEGRLSVNALQLISASGGSVAVNVEVRY